MTARPGRLPIDPLSDEAWKRVREEVFAELETAPERALPARGNAVRRYLLPLLAAALSLTALALALYVSRPKAPVQPAIPSRIVTIGSVTRATVGDATLEVAPGSALVTSGSDATGFVVHLERGTVGFSVPQRGERASFRVQAGEVAVEVIGTRFGVARTAETVSVSVEEGSVRLTFRGRWLTLGTGERWTTQSPEGAAASGNVSLRPAPEPSAREAMSAEVAAAPRPASSALAHPLPPATQGAKASPTPSPRERYEAASRLESKRPDEAIASYLELGRGSDGWAANALYAAGRLEFERGRRPAARALLEQYLRRFPKGPNAREARALLDRMH